MAGVRTGIVKVAGGKGWGKFPFYAVRYRGAFIKDGKHVKLWHSKEEARKALAKLVRKVARSRR